MHYRTVPMPSPAGTNHENLFLRVPVPSLAYDSARGLREDEEYEDEMPDRLPDGFMDRMVKVFANLPLTPDDIEKLKKLVEDLSNPGALDARRFASDDPPEFEGRRHTGGGTMDQKRRASLGMDARSLSNFYARFPQAARILVR